MLDATESLLCRGAAPLLIMEEIAEVVSHVSKGFFMIGDGIVIVNGNSDSICRKSILCSVSKPGQTSAVASSLRVTVSIPLRLRISCEAICVATRATVCIRLRSSSVQSSS